MSNISMHLFIVEHCSNREDVSPCVFIHFVLNTINDKQNNWNIVVVGNISKGYELNNGKWIGLDKETEKYVNV